MSRLSRQPKHQKKINLLRRKKIKKNKLKQNKAQNLNNKRIRMLKVIERKNNLKKNKKSPLKFPKRKKLKI